MGFEIIKLEPEHWSTVREIYVEGLRTGQATFETSAPSWGQWNAVTGQHLSGK